MPNAPRPDNPVRPVRVEDQLWHDALKATHANGTTVSEVVRKALKAYVKRHADK